MKPIKFILLSIIAVNFLTACKQNVKKNISDEAIKTAKNKIHQNKNKIPIMTFDSNEYDFGTINEGESVNVEFKFTNTGKGDLIIMTAQPSCGCTVAEFPKNTPIKPGESNIIKAMFNSSHKRNKQNKSITLTTNTESQIEVVYLKGFVTPKEQ